MPLYTQSIVARQRGAVVSSSVVSSQVDADEVPVDVEGENWTTLDQTLEALNEKANPLKTEEW